MTTQSIHFVPDAAGPSIDFTPDASTPSPPAIPQSSTIVHGGIGPLFPATGTEGPVAAAAKVAGNLIPSALNFAVGAVKAPIEGLMHIGDIPGAAMHLGMEQPNPAVAVGNLASGVYENLIPSAARNLVNAGIKGSGIDRFLPKGLTEQIAPDKVGDALTKAQAGISNDPVGQILPFILAGRGVAEKMGIGEQFDSVMSNVAQGVLKPANAVIGAPARAVGGFVGNTAGNIVKFGASQATGLNPTTMETVVGDQGAFGSKAPLQTRMTLAEDIAGKLDDKITALESTGKQYAPVRESGAQVPVGINDLDTLIKETTGLDIDKATLQLKTSGSADLRNPSDVTALQRKIYDVWKPEFMKGHLTADEFLNLRQDLATMANYEGLGKSKPLQDLSSVMRGKLNTLYRDQIPGLSDVTDTEGNVTPGLDSQFRTQAADLKELRQGLLSKDGNLTDAAVNRIANATGKGKDLLASRLEEISPGITQKIKIVKAIEDIDDAMGPKVGTYNRALGVFKTGGAAGIGFFLGGPLGAFAAGLAELIISNPKVAVPLLRSYGMGADLVGGVKAYLTEALNAGNNIPSLMKGEPLSTFAPKTIQGMQSLMPVSK